ncbi:hypothetical protein N7540_011456 [Penicillium herquei]|nr:hypothetical protein N7540_011456 [Penicillium herquei]
MPPPSHLWSSNQLKTPATAPTNTLFSLAGRTVVITGGVRVLGMTLTTAVLEAGCDLACLDLLDEPSADEWIAVQELARSKGLQEPYTRCGIRTNRAR